MNTSTSRLLAAIAHLAAPPTTAPSTPPPDAPAACGQTAVSGFTSCPKPIPGLDKLQVIIGYVMWGAVAVAVIGVLAFGAKMALSHQRGENAKGAGKVVGGLLILSVAGSFTATLLGFNLFTTTPEAIPGLTVVQTVISWVAWLAAAACVVGMIIVGAQMVAAHNNGRSEDVQKLGFVIGGALLVGSASAIVGAII